MLKCLVRGVDTMPSARIHEAIAKKINQEYNFDELLLRIGTISPDCWRNIPKDSGVKDKYLSHFWDFRVKEGQANNYVNFYIKYYNSLNNPFYLGYLLHLIVDQYWKSYVDPKYERRLNGELYVVDKNGVMIKDENWFSYYEGIKMQQRLAKRYHLDYLPINIEDYREFSCEIDELNINGLFGENGSIDYINKSLFMNDDVEESVIYDDESIEKDINETIQFIKQELLRLKDIKNEYDSKIKIAVDIDDTILSTKELEDHYWKIFLKEHPEIDSTKEYHWGDPELALFWKEHREDMAYGKIKNGVTESFNKMLEEGYIVDLLSARPIDKYASLLKKLSEYFESNNVNYNQIHLGFYSKINFLLEHKYDILIDNELRHIETANKNGISTILYGPFNPNYNGVQTDDWSKIPLLIDKITKSKSKII